MIVVWFLSCILYLTCVFDERGLRILGASELQLYPQLCNFFRAKKTTMWVFRLFLHAEKKQQSHKITNPTKIMELCCLIAWRTESVRSTRSWWPRNLECIRLRTSFFPSALSVPAALANPFAAPSGSMTIVETVKVLSPQMREACFCANSTFPSE